MNTKEIIKNNILLAEFLGAELEETESNLFVYCLEMPDHTDLSGYRKEFYEQNELQFHSNWNWLMQTVQNINLIDDYNYTMRINSMDVSIHSDKHKKLVVDYFSPYGAGELISGVYEACVEFVKWYNKNKSEN